MEMPNHVYLVITGCRNITKTHRPRWEVDSTGDIVGAYPTATLAEEHASKLVEKAQNNFERIFKAKPTVIGDGWNKAVVYDDQEKIGITWINIERYEMQTEVRIE